MYFLDIFICKNAARSFELAWTLSCSPWYNWFMHAVSNHEKVNIMSPINKDCLLNQGKAQDTK